MISIPRREWPALRLNSSVLNVTGLDNAVYFEISRTDAPATPFRQGVFHAYRHKGELRLRVFDFVGPASGTGGGLRDAFALMWAAPEAMPKVSVEQLVPNLDLVVSPAGSGWTGARRGCVRPASTGSSRSRSTSPSSRRPSAATAASAVARGRRPPAAGAPAPRGEARGHGWRAGSPVLGSVACPAEHVGAYRGMEEE